jgi:hypothetical protein
MKYEQFKNLLKEFMSLSELGENNLSVESGDLKNKQVNSERYPELDDALDEEDLSGMQLSIGHDGKADVKKPKGKTVDPREKEPSMMDFGGYKFENKKNSRKKKR